MTSERQRCWVTHRNREVWTACPLCHAPIAWVRLISGEWTPCDEEPELVTRGGKYKVVLRRELLEGYRPLKGPARREKPVYARVPHFYTCPVLRAERREWARANER